MNECSPTKKVFKILKLPAIILTCLAIIATLGGWYMAYAQNTATVKETLRTHTDDIAELKDNDRIQQQVDNKQTEILIRLDEFYRITQGANYSLATIRADSISKALNDSLNNHNPNIPENKIIYTTDGFIIVNGDTVGTIIPKNSGEVTHD